MSKVTQKGQVTIPQNIRAILKIKIGDEVIFKEDNGKIVVTKKKASINNIKTYIGYLSHFQGRSSDEIVNELRGE
ncbi:MAG: AbrB/MazE/SpoVT family DNA-binding domain-containing protein [bacterium]